MTRWVDQAIVHRHVADATEVLSRAHGAKLVDWVGDELAKEIADLRQEKRRTRPSKDSGPDAVAKHAAVLAKLDAVMTKAAIAYRQRELEAPMVVHEIKADTTELLNNSARIEATVQDTNRRVAQMEGKVNDLHGLLIKHEFTADSSPETTAAQADIIIASARQVKAVAKTAAKAKARAAAEEAKTKVAAARATAKEAAKKEAETKAAAKKVAQEAAKKAAKEAAEADKIRDIIRNL